MNDLSKMYQVYVNKELQVNKNEILNVARLKQKTLSFLHDLGEVCQDSRCFISVSYTHLTLPTNSLV